MATSSAEKSNNSNDGDMESAGSSGYGHGVISNYGYPTFVYKEEEDCDTGINPVLALSTIGILGAATLFIFRRITNSMGRRKKRDEDAEIDTHSQLMEMVYTGVFTTASSHISH